MDITIRAATAQDHEAICQILEEVDLLHREKLPHIYRKPDGPAREQDYFLGLLADEDHALLVAEADAEPVGFAHVSVRDTPPIPLLVPRRVAMVDDVVVKSDHRRAGLGRALMERAHQWARAKGASEVQLTVYEFNQPAVRFYQALGYTVSTHQMSRGLE
jgi:ribosomal protein S18 acetylase RimI-like enzyme